VSSRYLKTNAVAAATAHAREYYTTHPRIDTLRIAADTSQAHATGLLAFITARSEALRHVTLQPTTPLEPETGPGLLSVPPRPPPDTLENYHALPDGGPILVPDSFIPDGCPASAPKEAGYALAIEHLFQKDVEAGLALVFPLSDAHRLFADANLPLNATPTSIVAATGKPQGRLVVDVTRSRLNHPDKKALLAAAYGPIVYPTHVHWCRLFASVRALFPDNPLAMFSADYDRWFKRVRLVPGQVGLLAMPFHIDGVAHVVIPLVGQFGCQEFNYMASQASAFIYARVRARDIATYGGPIRLCLSDDTAGFIPPALYPADDVAFTALAEHHAGHNAAPPTKKELQTVKTTVGALYDLSDMSAPTIGISETLFLKLVCVFFLELPRDLVPGRTRIKYKQYQRMGSYMHLAASFIPPVRPFTHSVYANITGVHHTTDSVAVSHRSVTDITFWRATLYGTMYNTQWLRVPMHVLPLTTRPPDVDAAAFAHHQAAHAHAIIGTDAATNEAGTATWGGGWTACRAGPATGEPAQPAAWGTYQLPLFRPFLDSGALSPDELARCDQINLYEAIVVVLACDAVLDQWDSLFGDRPAHLHLHVWCDNTSAIAWLTRYKNHHPLINLVLQVWSRLQCEHHVTLTLGHIPGVENTVPDAISRRFRVEGGSAIQASLSHLTPRLRLPPWWARLLTSSTTQSETAWQTARAALTGLARPHSSSLPTSTTSTSST
jgi:hypothetical protein